MTQVDYWLFIKKILSKGLDQGKINRPRNLFGGVIRRAQSLLATWPLRYTGNNLIHRGKRAVEFSTIMRRHKSRNPVINSSLRMVAASCVHNSLLFVFHATKQISTENKKKKRKKYAPSQGAMYLCP